WCCWCYGWRPMGTTRRSTTTAVRRSRSRSRGKANTRARRNPRRPAAKPAGRWRGEFAAQLGGHSTDALALGLFVLALVSALGMFSSLARPVGDAIDAAAAVM